MDAALPRVQGSRAVSRVVLSRGSARTHPSLLIGILFYNGVPMGTLSTHTHECPRCGAKWECGEANYQDECPHPVKTLCTKCWATQKPEKPVSVEGKGLN